MPDRILQLKQVTKRYGTANDPASTEVLRGIDLEVEPGESLAIVGPSGCGKSTLLNIIGALDTPTEGTVTLRGRDLQALSTDQRAALRNAEIGFVFQHHYLLPQCDALENVLIPTLATGAPTNASGLRDRASELLGRVGLAQRLHHQPGALSGGERQRVAIARALINQPAILLVDEPTGMLDERTAATIVDLLAELNQRDNVTLMMVTHAQAFARKQQRMLHLSEGQLHPVAPSEQTA